MPFTIYLNTLFLMIYTLIILCYVAALSSRSILSMLLFLVCSYVSTALYLASYGLVYSALLYVLVYIGAIVVLFIYVVQLINTDITYTSQSSNRSVLIVNIMLILSVLVLFTYRSDNIDLLLEFSSSMSNILPAYDLSIGTVYTINNLNTLASSLFNDYAYILIIAVHAIVLAIIGPIRLAYQHLS